VLVTAMIPPDAGDVRRDLHLLNLLHIRFAATRAE
jgi:hypothetical protein